MGFKFEFAEGYRKCGELDVDRLAIDFQRPINPRLPADVQKRVWEVQRRALEAAYGMPIMYELAYRQKSMLAACGKQAPEALDELVRHVRAGKAGTPAMTGTLQRAPKGSFLVGEIELIEHARSIADMIGNVMPPEMRPTLELGEAPAKPASFWCVAVGGELEVRYAIPVAPVSRIAAGIRRARQELMDRIKARAEARKVPAPPPGEKKDGDVEKF
jgi:hypothetical protein